jgi:hypothetical protein
MGWLMAVPAYTIDGVLPPFLGSDPGGDPAAMSPYIVTATEVVDRFGTTVGRRAIMKGWLDHRAALRPIGIMGGFQWLDGSFLEDKEPSDLDLVIFVTRPPGATDMAGWIRFLTTNHALLDRPTLKAQFKLDVLFLDLDGNREALISLTRYYLQLFSHQRQSFLWKGMLHVPLDNAGDDTGALAHLFAAASGPVGGQP